MHSRTFRLFQPTDTHSCSYLNDRDARSTYVDPGEELDQQSLTLLSLNGFRRSGRLLYRPDCPGCSACQSVRLRLSDFKASRNQRRILRRNQDLRLSVAKPMQAEAGCYALFERYINTRHADGDMYPASREQFADFLLIDFGTSRFLLAHRDGELVACMVFDLLLDGVSSVYCFYDPEEEKRSLGTFMILCLNQLAQGLSLPYNYLGYYVEGSRKMDYKANFSPLEAWNGHYWQPLTE